MGLEEDGLKLADHLYVCYSTHQGLPCSEPAAYPGEPPLGDDELHEAAMSPSFPHLQCLTHSRARVSACLGKALLCMLDPNSGLMSCAISSVSFHSMAWEGCSSSFIGLWRPPEASGIWSFYCKASLNGLWPPPNGFLSKAWRTVRAWALFGVQPDSSGDYGEVFRVFGTSFSCYKIFLVCTSHQPTSKALKCYNPVFTDPPE